MIVITEEPQIANLVSQLRGILRSNLASQVNAIVGYRGGNMPLTLHWSEDVQMWMAYESTEDFHLGRFWTAFGLEQPFPNRNTQIVTEINFPMSSIDRRLGGVFIITPADGILIGHRGRIGGGRNGIGKNLFWDNYRGRILSATDGDRESEFAFVGDLNSANLAYQVRNFVAEVERIKSLGTESD